jgi:signal transduction histidine kinase
MHDHLNNLEREELIRIIEEKSDYLSLMIHQLRTPLTAQKWFLESLSRENVSGHQNPNLEQAQTSMLNALKLLDEMTQSNHCDEWKLSFHPQTISLSQVLMKTIALLGNESLAKHVSIIYEPDITIPDTVTADPETFCIVLQNILENSIKYSPTGSTVTITTKLFIENIVIMITDQGIGIPYDAQKEIFKKFYRAQNAKDYSTGTGLGLYVANKICQYHHSSLWFESIPDIGTTFFIKIPLAK